MAKICGFKKSIYENSNVVYPIKCNYCIGVFSKDVYTKCETFVNANKDEEKGCEFRRKIRQIYDNDEETTKLSKKILEDIKKRRASNVKGYICFSNKSRSS